MSFCHTHRGEAAVAAETYQCSMRELQLVRDERVSLRLQPPDLVVQLRDAHFGLHGLLAAVGDAVMVERLVGLQRQPQLVSHAQQQQPSLGALARCVADHLVCRPHGQSAAL